jgi:prepilin peptidase CpaA
MLQNLALILFPMLMAFAGASDLLTMRIPNQVSVALALAYFVLAAWLGASWETLVLHAIAGIVVLGLALLAYLPGWIGGGDAKLVAATAVWVGWEHLLDYGVMASVAGGLVTIVVIGIAWFDLSPIFTKFPFVRLLAKRVNCVPYGVALAIGGVFVYPQTEIWQGLAAL